MQFVKLCNNASTKQPRADWRLFPILQETLVRPQLGAASSAAACRRHPWPHAPALRCVPLPLHNPPSIGLAQPVTCAALLLGCQACRPRQVVSAASLLLQLPLSRAAQPQPASKLLVLRPPLVEQPEPQLVEQQLPTPHTLPQRLTSKMLRMLL